MPRLTGPQTLAAVRRLAPDVPCCFMSGGLTEELAARLRDWAAVAVLAKPFHPPAMVRTLRRLIGAPAQVGGGPPSPAQPNYPQFKEPV
jgi:CheY-like chemotaxis protein